MRTLTVLLVGSGSMGAEHGAALAGSDGARIAGFVSRTRGPAEGLARRFGGRAFRSLADGLTSRPDVVFILTPTPTHLPLVRQAVAHGCAVFCEKPLARTERDAESILKIIGKAKVPFMTGHVLRFFPDYATLRRLVVNGELGAIGVARLSRTAKAPAGSGNWFADVDRSGGPLLDLAIHDFDWLRWTFGEVDRVHARIAPQAKANLQSYALAVLRMKSGPIAHVETGWGHGLPFRATAEIAGAKSIAHADTAHPTVFNIQKDANPGKVPAVAVPESPLAKSPYRVQDAHFLDCVRNGTEPKITGHDALMAVRISLAAIESGRTGKAVKP